MQNRFLVRVAVKSLLLSAVVSVSSRLHVESSGCLSFVGFVACSVARFTMSCRIVSYRISGMNRNALSKWSRNLHRRPLLRMTRRCVAGSAGSQISVHTFSAHSYPSPFAFTKTLRRSRRPSLRSLHIMKSDASWQTLLDGWRELSAALQTQIYGYIPVLHSCPLQPELDSSRSLLTEVVVR